MALRGKIKTACSLLYKSVWFFPAILAVPLILFTVLQISGSSIGTQRLILYGPNYKDKNVLLNEPRSIRSDEWLVNTQMTIAQAKEGFPLVNHHIGQGENMSIIVDVPYADWSTLFKPQNLAFFLMPFLNAFAFKWWFMGYLLIIACYFFILALLPKRRLLAASLATSLFFSAFVQWWYLQGTLASLAYPLLIMTSIIQLTRQKVLWKKIAWGVLIAYLATCFALILYPPFQIACGMVALAFLAGYFLENYTSWGKRELLRNLLIIGASGVVALAIIGTFVATRMDVIKTATHTVYPGQRSIPSGGPLPSHIMSAHLGHQFMSEKRNAHYLIDNHSPSNQSETSNFLLLTPFLFLPSLYLIYRSRKKGQQMEWSLLLVNGLFIIFLLETFVTQFTPISKILLLDKVGGGRLLIGMGLLNLVALVLVIRNLAKNKFTFPRRPLLIYCLAILVIELMLSFHAHSFGFFISTRGAILLSLPLPLVVYLLFRKRFIAASLLYLAFSIFTAGGVNPLYHGLSAITNDPLGVAVREVGATSDKRWVSDGGYLENIASIQDEPSLSGVYGYPQLDLWKDVPGATEDMYNRYAHTGFQITDDLTAPTKMVLITPDSFVVRTNTCSDYLRKKNVGFVVSASVLKSDCSTLLKTIPYPMVTLYIYSLR